MKFNVGDRIVWVEKTGHFDIVLRGEMMAAHTGSGFVERTYTIRWDDSLTQVIYLASEIERGAYLEGSPEATWYLL